MNTLRINPDGRPSRADAFNLIKDLVAASNDMALIGMCPPADHEDIRNQIRKAIVAVFKALTNTSPTSDELDMLIKLLNYD